MEHLFCCGAPDRTELNVVARLSDSDESAVQQLTPELRIALQHLESSPDMFPVTINLFYDQVRLVKMSPFWYEESTFLDAPRITGTCTVDTNVQWLANHTQNIQWQRTPIIFHTAFCGSTNAPGSRYRDVINPEKGARIRVLCSCVLAIS